MTTYLGKFGRRFIPAAVLISAALLLTPGESVAQEQRIGLPWVGTWSSAMQGPTDIFQPT
jgi:hypothetical protein